jgi:hypothetical protein
LIRSLAHTEAVIDFGDDDRESDISDSAMWTLVPRIEVPDPAYLSVLTFLEHATCPYKHDANIQISPHTVCCAAAVLTGTEIRASVTFEGRQKG